MKRLIAIIAIFALTLAACSSTAGGEESEAKDSDTTEITIEDIENAERGKEKARLIAQYVTQESDGLVFVTYSDIPSHGIDSRTGKDFFGVHYSMTPLRHSDELTNTDEVEAERLAGLIFKLTTQYILDGSPAITHMGVQIVNPDAWFWEGQDAHLYIASANDLLDLPSATSLDSWFATANDTPILLITESQLRQLLEQLEGK